MTTILTLAALAALAILAVALHTRRAVRARYAGRRDQHHGAVDVTRTDLAYVDGAATEYLRRTGGAA